MNMHTLRAAALTTTLAGAPHALAALESEEILLTGEGPACQGLCDQFGGSLVSRVDLNGDGITDLVASAFGRRSAYVFFGPFDEDRPAGEADIVITSPDVNPAPVGGGPGVDVNGDGFHDLLIGARNGGIAGSTLGGQVWIFYGPLTTDGVIRKGALGDADATIMGENFFELGRAMATHDLDGDGNHDLLVGASQNQEGRALVYRGPIGGTLRMADADTTIRGVASFENFGDAVAIGDLNDDGVSDLVVGAEKFPLDPLGAGRTYVFFGPVPDGNFSAGTADVIIGGEAINDQFGFDVAIAGDVNGDGSADLLVGAEQSFGTGSGKAYLFLGPLAAGQRSAATADAIFNSEPGGGTQRFGRVSTAGDVNGDGLDDVMIAAPDVAGLSGRVYLFTGPLAGVFEALDADAVFSEPGPLPIDRLGTGLAAAGDLDGNGLDDIVLGAPGFEEPGFVRMVFFAGVDCAGDIDGSGAVDIGDLLAILIAWGPCKGACPEDLDGSGAVDFGDILAVLAAWGDC